MISRLSSVAIIVLCWIGFAVMVGAAVGFAAYYMSEEILRRF